MNTQLPAGKVYIGLTEEAEYNLKQARCEERRQNGLAWIVKWQAVMNNIDKKEVV